MSRPSKLAIQIVRAAYALTKAKDRPGYWVSIDDVFREAGIAHSPKADAAVEEAERLQLLRTSGGPEPYDGTVLAEKK